MQQAKPPKRTAIRDGMTPILIFLILTTTIATLKVTTTLKETATEKLFYEYLSCFTIRIFPFMMHPYLHTFADNEYQTIRDFQYKTHWYAKKLEYTEGGNFYPTPKVVEKEDHYTYWMFNESATTIIYYVASMTLNPKPPYETDVIIALGGARSKTNPDKIYIYIDSIKADTDRKIQVWNNNTKLLDTNNDKQYVGTDSGWVITMTLQDTLLPDYKYEPLPYNDSQNIPWIPCRDNDTSLKTTIRNPLDETIARLGIKLYRHNPNVKGEWELIYERLHLQDEKWYVKIYERTKDYVILGTEDIWNGGQNIYVLDYIDLIMKVTTTQIKWIFCCGGFKKELYYETDHLGSNQWKPLFLEWQNNDYTKDNAFNLYLPPTKP